MCDFHQFHSLLERGNRTCDRIRRRLYPLPEVSTNVRSKNQTNRQTTVITLYKAESIA